MRYKQLRNANEKISAIAVGTWAIGGENYGQVDRNDSIEAIRAMIDNGVNIIDTAPDYGNGESEKIVGEAIKDIRDKVLISTKFGYTRGLFYENRRDSSFKNVLREVDSSLFNLKTDYIDFYFIHVPDLHTPFVETMSALNYLKSIGKIKHIGVSNFTKEQLEEIMKYGQIDVIQPPYSMVNTSNKELMEFAYSKGIDTFTYGSLGSGILTGSIRKMPEFDKDDYRKTFYDFYQEPKFSKIMELLKTLDVIAEKHNRPVAQVAINWSTQQDIVGTALAGVKNSKQANENCAAFDWELTQEEIDQINNELDRLNI